MATSDLLYSTRSECASFWQRIFERNEEGEKKARRRPPRPSSTFFETDEVAAKKVRQKAQIVTASSILEDAAEKHLTCLNRRDFLLFGSTAATTIILASLPGFARADQGAALRVAAYPRKRIGRLSRLRLNDPVEFHYPYEHPHCTSFLVKMGAAAGGGVGSEHDVVAFNALCTHQGGLLSGMYDGTYRIAGPCPMHLSTFDLTRHGLVVAGHGTQSLPQVVLEADKDVLYATGMMGLIYGFSSNLPRNWKEGG